MCPSLIPFAFYASIQPDDRCIPGMDVPRRRFGPLPEPRDIRVKVHERSRPLNELKKLTHYLMFFGQMLSHDMQENVLSESKISLFVFMENNCPVFGRMNIFCVFLSILPERR